MHQVLYNIFTFTHHWLSNILYVALFLLVVWIIFQLKKSFKPLTKKFASIIVILADSMLVIGLSLYFFGNIGLKSFSFYTADSIMHQKIYRFYSLEHPLGMIVAIILLHVGKIAMNKAPEESKNKKLLLWFSLALIVISISYPTFRGILTSEFGIF